MEHIDNETTAGQEEVLAFLGGTNRPDPNVRRVDTHASIVFLGSERVLKIKRAVRLPYLDYSTIEKRRQACEDELTVNKRHAPAIYRRVVPITRDSGGLAIGGSGPVVEWAVEMERFDERKALDRLAAQNAIGPDLAEALAGVLLESHAGAEASDVAKWLASLPGIIDRNTEHFRFAPVLARHDVDELHELSHRLLSKQFELLQQRVASGQVRRCHGDAHLGNIVLIDGKPVLFDAIEFDPVIATTDVLYDLAFPIMDLWHFGQRAAANRLFNRYLQLSWGDQCDALRLLPLFLSIRAAIRANVLLTRQETCPRDRSIALRAKSYFDLARRLIVPAAASLTAIGGKSGTGKSLLARDIAGLIAPPPGAVLLRSDVVRKDLFGVAEYVTLPRSTYTTESSRRVYEAMIERARAVLAQGLSAVIDAAFLRAQERDAVAAAAREASVALRCVFLTADLGARLRRVSSRQRDASDATADVVLDQNGIDTGRIVWPVVDASGSPAETLARSVPWLQLPDCPD